MTLCLAKITLSRFLPRIGCFCPFFLLIMQSQHDVIFFYKTLRHGHHERKTNDDKHRPQKSAHPRPEISEVKPVCLDDDTEEVQLIKN